MEKHTEYHLVGSNLCVVLGLDSGVGVRHPNGKLFGTFDNLPSYTARDRLGNSGSVGAVVHHEHLQFGHIADHDALESMGVDVASDLIRTVTNRGVGNASLEFTADTTVNTSGLSPRGIYALEEFRLVFHELLRPLLYNGFLYNRGRTGHFGNLSARWVGENGEMKVPVSEGGLANVNDPQIFRIRRTSTSRRGGFRSQSNLPRKIAGGWEQQGTTTR